MSIIQLLVTFRICDRKIMKTIRGASGPPQEQESATSSTNLDKHLPT